MNTSKLRPVLKLTSCDKKIIRTIAITSNEACVHSKSNLKSWREIPGPSSLPVIGQLHHYLFDGELTTLSQPGAKMKLFEKYGPIIRFDSVPGMKDMIVLGDPDAASQVLRGENWLPIRRVFFSFEHYRREYKEKRGEKVITTGLITEHGQSWRDFRTIVNPIMMDPKTIRLYTKEIDEVAQDMIKRMQADRDENNMLQRKFDDEMNLWALESIGTVALGCRLNFLDSDLQPGSPEEGLIQCVNDFFASVDQLDFKPSLWRYFSTAAYKKAMDAYMSQEKYTRYFVKKGIERLKENAIQKSDSEKPVLQKLLEINEDVAVVMACDMLAVSVDTVGNSVTAILYLLALNQDKQDKLRQEILSNSEQRPYLKACIKEGMRMMPVGSGNLRTTTQEYNLLGYRIPKDMAVLIAHQEMSLMEQYYPRAKEYIPERWTADKEDPLYYGHAHPFASNPFGFGSRMCIGRRIAELEIESFVARVVENFKIEWSGPPPVIKQTMLNYIKGPFNFVFKDVK